jgi:hypothetical protein
MTGLRHLPQDPPQSRQQPLGHGIGNPVDLLIGERHRVSPPAWIGLCYHSFL